MQRNYEEQLEKMRGAAAAQPPSLQVPTQSLGSKLVEQIQQRKLLFSKTVSTHQLDCMKLPDELQVKSTNNKF